jgi:hypothetical protein
MRGGALVCLIAVFAATAARTEPEEHCRIRTVGVAEDGVATIEAHCSWAVKPEWLIAILRDPARLAAALSTLIECRAVPGGRVEVHSVGWPIADRQVTLDWREHALPDGGSRFVYSRAKRQEPLAARRIQIEIDEGWWEVRRVADGSAALVYSSRYDAGANLDPLLARPFLHDGIARSLRELRSAAEAFGRQAVAVGTGPPRD